MRNLHNLEFSDKTAFAVSDALRYLLNSRDRYQKRDWFDDDYPRLNYAGLAKSPEALSAHYRAKALVELASTLLHGITTKLNLDLTRFEVSHGYEETLVEAYHIHDLLPPLAMNAFVHLNLRRLEAVIHELRGKSEDIKAFDATVFGKCAIGVIWEKASEIWDRDGADNLIIRAASDIKQHFGVEIELLTHEQALQQLAMILSGLSSEYARLLKQAGELEERAAHLSIAAASTTAA